MTEVTPEMVPSVQEAAPAAPTPSAPETPTPPVAPEAAAPAETPAQPAAEQLYDLPDGRKVDAETLRREWKENFLPDYTRKSQKLAEIEKHIKSPNEEPPKKPWEQPDYTPQSWSEVLELAEKRTLERIQQQAQQAEEQTKAIAAEVDKQLSEIKATDPQLDENALFHHANKFGFRDLKSAHANMQAIKAAALAAEERTLKNLKARGLDPISGQPSPTGLDTGIDPDIAQKYGSAVEFFNRIKGN
jgi:DNA-binding transcriptional MerR regulator